MFFALTRHGIVENRILIGILYIKLKCVYSNVYIYVLKIERGVQIYKVKETSF